MELPLITLMTDFGIKDGNVGVMKGVILGICPSAEIVDISHTVGAQNIREAAYIIGKTWSFFPKDTIHVIVVDPGVGTSRRPLAGRIGNQYFVGPDNGLITLPKEQTEAAGGSIELVVLNQPRFWLPVVSHVFHGRDIFSPCAAHLAMGTKLNELGSQISDPVLLNFPKPVQKGNIWEGEIIQIDHFGNVSSNIRTNDLRGVNLDKAIVRIKSSLITGIVATFGDKPVGELISLFGSTGNLIVSIVNGNAADKLGVKVGDPIVVEISS